MKVTTATWYEAKKLEKQGRRIVSISRGDPQWFKPDWKIWDLCPSWELINGWRDGTIDEAKYRKQYAAEIEPTVAQSLTQIEDGDVLCCWEKEGFCHRFVVADLLEAAGHEVERR